MLIALGLALVLAGKASPDHHWMLPMGLPFLALGFSVAAAGLVPFLHENLTTPVFIALGISIIAADSIAAPGRAWAASLAVLAIAIGFILLAVGPPSGGSVIPGWSFGASLVVLALVVWVIQKYRREPTRADRTAHTTADVRPTARTLFVRGALVFAGGVGVSVVAGWDHNLYMVVAALGICYLVPGLVTKQRRWTESGMLLSVLGTVIVSTDVIPSAATYIYGMVFGAIAVAMLLLQTFSVGRIGGVGRSIIAVSGFLFVLSVLPDVEPFGTIGKNVDVLLPLLPAGSGIMLLARAWVRSGGLRPGDGSRGDDNPDAISGRLRTRARDNVESGGN